MLQAHVMCSHNPGPHAHFMEPTPSSLVTTTAVLIYNIELIILILANVICLLFLSVLKKSQSFHVNLRLLLGNFSLTFLLVIISRYMIITPLWLAYFFNVDIAGIMFCRLAKALHDTGIYVSGLGLAVLVIERTVATVFVRSYETNRNKYIGVLLIVLQWVFGFLFVFMNQIQHEDLTGAQKLACQIEYTAPAALQLSLVTVIASDIVGIVVFLTLLQINKYRYRNVNRAHNRMRLSERYQTAENVRTTRLLFPMVFTYLLASLLAGAIMMYGTFAYKKLLALRISQGYAPNAEIFQSFDIITATYACVFPFLAMYGHTSLYATMRQILCKQKKVSPQVPLSLDGRQLVLPTTEESEFHFASLEQMWNRAADAAHVNQQRRSGMVDL